MGRIRIHANRPAPEFSSRGFSTPFCAFNDNSAHNREFFLQNLV